MLQSANSGISALQIVGFTGLVRLLSVVHRGLQSGDLETDHT